MNIEIGVPGSGTKVVIDVDAVAGDQRTVEEKVVDALKVLKLAGDTWVAWSRETETPEQAVMRELMEENGVLKKRAIAAENAKLEEMLSGSTDGIRSGDM